MSQSVLTIKGKTLNLINALATIHETETFPCLEYACLRNPNYTLHIPYLSRDIVTDS